MRERALPGNSMIVGDLVCSMLAVNNWSLQRSLGIYSQLEDEGLFDLERLEAMDRTQIFASLDRAGYDKSGYVVGLLADRIKSMTEILAGDGIVKLRGAEVGHWPAHLDAFLLTIRGVGSVVLRNFKILRGLCP